MVTKPTLKQRVYELLDKSDKTRTSEKLYDVFIIILIGLNVIAVVVEPSARDPLLQRLLNYFEAFSIMVFSIEYLLRLWISDISFPSRSRFRSMMRYVLSPMALVDLAAVLPFYLPLLLPVDLRVLRVFRIFRMLRIFKANRYTDALSTVLQVIRNKSDQLVSSLFVVFSLMMVASVLMFNIENTVQPEEFNSVLDALFWSATVLTSINFDDLVPLTLAGRILGSIVALLGVGAIAIPTGILASGFTELSQQAAASTQQAEASIAVQLPESSMPSAEIRSPEPVKLPASRSSCPHCGQPLMLLPARPADASVDDRPDSEAN